jgi:hypothetical protein
MQVSDFLATVLPPPGHGYYCAVELTTPRREHRFLGSTEELLDAAVEFNDSGKDSYFGLATYTQGTNRTAANAAYIRCFFADVDVGVGKPYERISDALEALGKWCAASGFPEPFLVGSGGGIHAYWPFIEPVPVAAWRPQAEAFKKSCESQGFRIDYSVSADAARVLRVPGTHNRKRLPHKRVRLKAEGEAHPFSFYTRLLESHQPKAGPLEVGASDSVLDTAPKFAVGNQSFKTDIQEISQANFDRILEAGCKQIDFYRENATQDGMEPLWRGVISIAKYCVNGEVKAREMSALHPYDEDRLQKKWHEIKGPYSCDAFGKTTPGLCNSCQYRGKITNPLALGKELKPQEHKEVEVAVGTYKQTQTFPDPPDGYTLSERGVGISFSDAEGIPRIAFVADTPFFASITYDRAGERYVQFTYIEHGTAKSNVMPLAVATARDDSIKAFARLGIIVPTGQDAGFRSYVKSTIAQAKKTPPLLMPTSLGWQYDDTFAFDSRIFTPDGERVVPMYGFDNINETMGVRGTLDGWRLVIAGMVRLQRWDILSMMLLGFASPLMKFTGLNGVTFHLCGNDSGRGKTLCQRLASSVWGVPDKFRVTPNTSPVAMVNRLGMLGNLPLMVDEITHKGRNEAEWFPEFLSQMSDGRGKDRMESQTNSERRNTTTWASVALMTSNKHMLDYLTAERSHGSEGEIRRLIEITFDRELNLDPLAKSLLFDTLPENYGVAGEAYARWMVRNVDTVKKVTKDTYTEVFKQFDASGDERFWIAGCACIIASARLISRNHANIVELPVGKIAYFLYETIVNMRGETKRMKRTAVDVLNAFTKRNFGKLVMVNNFVAKIAGIEVAEILDRRDLCGRVEKGDNGWVEYYIEERELKSFCSSMSYGYMEFKRDISKDCPVDYVRKDLLLGTRGPSMQVRCIHLRQKIDKVVDLFEKEPDDKTLIKETT